MLDRGGIFSQLSASFNFCFIGGVMGEIAKTVVVPVERERETFVCCLLVLLVRRESWVFFFFLGGFLCVFFIFLLSFWITAFPIASKS